MISGPRPRPRKTSLRRGPRPRLYFQSSRRLETWTVVSRTTSPHITSCTLLVGDGEFHVEVGKGELNQFVLVSHERVQDTVDVGVVDLWVVGRREHPLRRRQTVADVLNALACCVITDSSNVSQCHFANCSAAAPQEGRRDQCIPSRLL